MGWLARLKSLRQCELCGTPIPLMVTSGARAHLCVGKHKVERADPLAFRPQVPPSGPRLPQDIMQAPQH